MYFYRIEISHTTNIDAGLDDNKKPIIQKGVANKPLYVFSSHLANGQMNSGALNIIFNVSVSHFHNSAMVGSFFQIQGLELEFLSQAYDLRGKHIRIFGGMTKNYMVDKDNVGLLFNGIIVAPHGDWEGTNQALTFYILPSGFDDQKVIVLDWFKDQKLSDAIRSALSIAYPQKKIEVSVKEKNDTKSLKKQGGYYYNIEEFAIALNRQHRVYGTDPINIYSHENTLFVTDSSSGKMIQLKTKDMIGQPTWSDNNNITVKMVLRPDINVNDIVTFPNESSILGSIKPTNNSADYFFNRGTNADIKNKPIFQGEYLVLSVQHVGNYKSSEWITFLTLSTYSANDNVDVKRQYPKSPNIEFGGIY